MLSLRGKADADTVKKADEAVEKLNAAMKAATEQAARLTEAQVTEQGQREELSDANSNILSLKEAEAIGFDRLITQYYEKSIKRDNPVYIGKSDAMVSLFDSQAPLIITGSDLTKSIREKKGSRSAHDVPERFIRNLPANIDSSSFGYRSDRSGVPSFTIIAPDTQTGTLYAVGGAMNAQYEGRVVNRVLTIYPIENAEKYLQDSKRHIVTTDKSRAKIALEKAGIQSPALQSILDSMDTIPQSSEESKSFSLKDPVEETDREMKIMVADVQTLRSVGKKSISRFTTDDIRKADKWARIYRRDLGTKSPFFRAWFGEWRSGETNPVQVADIPEYIPTNEARKKNRGDFKNADTGWIISVSREGETNTISHSGKQRLSEYGLSGIKSLVENAILLDSEVHEHHRNNATNDSIAFDHKLYALGQDADGIALYKITVEEYFQDKKHPDKKRFHNLRYIEKVADIPGGRTSGDSRSGGSTSGDSATGYRVSDVVAFVKAHDPEFKPNEPSAFVNKDRTPKIMYRGDVNGNPRIFDRSKSKASNPDHDTVDTGTQGTVLCVFL